jgi:threonine-phosphate decarboxylase
VNVLAGAAAMTALNDKAHQRRTRDYVVSERERLWRAFAGMPGAQLQPTHANYYFAKLAYAAAPLCDYLHRHKILLRNCTGMPGVQGEAVRFAIRTCEDNDRLLQLWRAFPCD